VRAPADPLTRFLQKSAERREGRAARLLILIYFVVVRWAKQEVRSPALPPLYRVILPL
jgi:hypothetical protein